MKTASVILAAGLGKRMQSRLPKVLQKVCGIPMLQSVVDTARRLKNEKIVVVTGKYGDLIKQALMSDAVSYVQQKEPKGTGHALSCARQALRDFQGVVIVLNGDTPLVSAATLKKFLKQHASSRSALSVLSFVAEEPGDYGRILRDSSGHVLSIIEHKDADPAQRKIREVNSGVYAIRHDLLSLLDDIPLNRKKGEYYLTDIVALSAQKGFRTSALCVGSEREFMGVNTKQELYRASRIMEEAIIGKWIEKGVNVLDASAVFIHPCAFLGAETILYPNVFIDGHTRIGRGVTIYPNVRISNSRIEDRALIKDSTVIEESRVKAGAVVGPFAHVRPGSEIGVDAKIGNFVELKKAVIGKGTKASHLSYLGDARIGEGVNIGAGTITCNYDGRKKSMTVIGKGAFVGSDSQLVAPVTIGKGAYIGAGSTITKNVPPLALAVSRAEQRTIKDWVKKRRSLISEGAKNAKKKPGRVKEKGK
jgi:bifunctional UDP-N-acetylglucosamine pyrophosphorylase/glucosamine-1-phosphate N-acetyltransferase